MEPESSCIGWTAAMIDLITMIDAAFEEGQYGGSSAVLMWNSYRMELLRADALRRDIGLCHESAVSMVRASIGGNIIGSLSENDVRLERMIALHKSYRRLEKSLDLSLVGEKWDCIMMAVMLRKAEAVLLETAKIIAPSRRNSLADEESPPSPQIVELPDAHGDC
jgi:hypothetical protein